MRKLILIFSLIFTLSSSAQKLDGSWRGILEAGTQKLTTVLHISGKTVTMDIVEQGASKIPMTVDFISDDSLSLSLSQLMLIYQGKVKDGKLVGTFTQQAISVPLIFNRGDVSFNRPQEPKAPFPYTTEEVTFNNAKANAVLSGTLTMPEDMTKKVPVLLMVTGSGSQNRDEEVYHHKPFLVIADYLARHGIATLRYDDRGTAKSTGDFKSATTMDFADDAQAGLDYLRGLGRFSKVGVLGHSEGGSVAYILGSRIWPMSLTGKTVKRNPDFIVSLAGPACRMDTMMMVQLNGLYRASGYPNDVAPNVTAARKILLGKGNSVWMSNMLDMNVAPYVKSTRCPVLALGGDKDLNVPVSVNVPSLKANLAHGSHNIIKVYPGLNHLFQHCKTGNPQECVNIEETISPEVLKDIAGWVNALP